MPFFNVYATNRSGEKKLPATIIGNVTNGHQALRVRREQPDYVAGTPLTFTPIQVNSRINSVEMQRIVSVLNVAEPLGDIISVTFIDGPGSHVVIYQTLGDVRVMCFDRYFDSIWSHSAA